MSHYFFAFLVGYLCGSIPTAYWIGRLFYKCNIFEHGSKNMGATNVNRVLGKKPAIATLLTDIIKGVAAVLLSRYIFDEPYLELISAAAALSGHTFSFWVGFKGGKGVATGLGIFLALTTYSSLASFALFCLVTLILKMVSLGSIIASIGLPIFIYIFKEPSQTMYKELTIFSVFIALYVIYKHRANIKRIISGNESKLDFSFSKKSSNENNPSEEHK